MSTILSVKDLSVTFDVHKQGAWPWTPAQKLHAVSQMSFDIKAGECLGVVGESGSGKSTLARAIVGTVPSSNGQILFEGADLARMDTRQRRVHRRDVQMIFQDPLAALNPRMTVGDIIAEPLVTHEPKTPRIEVKRRVAELMERVGLLPNLINRYPHEFSGGQCQRIGIARALILKPKLIICDEPVSALDVSVQAQVLNLMSDLKDDLGLTYLFISHDLTVVQHISDRVGVLYLGRLVEEATPEELFDNPKHPYTQMLLAAAPKLGEFGREVPPPVGEIPDPINPPSGCAYHPRCPLANGRCKAERPQMRALRGAKVACHLAT